MRLGLVLWKSNFLINTTGIHICQHPPLCVISSIWKMIRQIFPEVLMVCLYVGLAKYCSTMKRIILPIVSLLCPVYWLKNKLYTKYKISYCCDHSFRAQSGFCIIFFYSTISKTASFPRNHQRNKTFSKDRLILLIIGPIQINQCNSMWHYDEKK